MNILAVGAHPDDVEIFMFGTLAAFAARGDTLTLAIATDGARGGTGAPGLLATRRRGEAEAAARLLNTAPRFLDFLDGGLVADAVLVNTLRALVADTAPQLVLAHAPGDYHGDHRVLSEAVRIAAGFPRPSSSPIRSAASASYPRTMSTSLPTGRSRSRPSVHMPRRIPSGLSPAWARRTGFAPDRRTTSRAMPKPGDSSPSFPSSTSATCCPRHRR